MSFPHKSKPGFELNLLRPASPGRLGVGPWHPRRILAAGGPALLLLLGPGPLAAQTEPPASEPPAIASVPPEDPVEAPPRRALRTGSRGADGASAARSAPALGPPRDLGDINGWLEYKSRAHVLALPAEARLFYRRGVLAHHAGKEDEGERWVRAAAELDPSFLAPHLAIAGWSLPERPSQAMLQWAIVIERARESFLLQAGFAANALFVSFQSLLIALLLAGMILVTLHVPELTHPWRERLGGILRAETARWWALAFAVLPYLAGLGAVLPTLLFLGLLWPVLRARERGVFVMLAAAVIALPWAAAVLERLATPLDADRAPFHGVALLENEPWSSAQQQRLATLAARDPENPFLHFGVAWIARRGGDLATAEHEYRRALERWPEDDRVLNNLGNVLAMEGRQDEALQLYARAVDARPTNPAPHFNSSQIYTQRFEFKPATEALARASALDFDLVREYQSGGRDGKLPLVDQWIRAQNFWLALGEAPGLAAGATSLPPSWRGHFETTDRRFGMVAALAGLIGIVFGTIGHRAVPLRACSNCGSTVCRRCAQRRREVALCRNCAKLESRAQSQDFAHVLMSRTRRRTEHLRHVLRTTFAALIPGFGLLAFRRAVTPVLLIAASLLLAAPWAALPLPFELEPRLAAVSALPSLPLWIGLGVVIYAWSIGGYFACVARARVATAGSLLPALVRPAQATGREAA